MGDFFYCEFVRNSYLVGAQMWELMRFPPFLIFYLVALFSIELRNLTLFITLTKLSLVPKSMTIWHMHGQHSGRYNIKLFHLEKYQCLTFSCNSVLLCCVFYLDSFFLWSQYFFLKPLMVFYKTSWINLLK